MRCTCAAGAAVVAFGGKDCCQLWVHACHLACLLCPVHLLFQFRARLLPAHTCHCPALCSAAYSRPIRWLLALHGDAVLPFVYAGLQAGAHAAQHADACALLISAMLFPGWKCEPRTACAPTPPCRRHHAAAAQLRPARTAGAVSRCVPLGAAAGQDQVRAVGWPQQLQPST